VTGVPVLAFHAVERGPGPLCIDPDTFRRQVDALVSSGVQSISLGELVDCIGAGRQIPLRAAVITFDDAYASVHEQALPILAQAGIRATVFAVPGVLGSRNTWDPPASTGALRIMGPAALVELRDAGWEIGAHTQTHRSLPELDDNEVQDEMARADAALEDLVGDPVAFFAYPFGHHDARTRRLAGARYRACVTAGAEMVQPDSDLTALPRVEAWYLRRPGLLRHLHGRRGSAYLALRRALRTAGRGGSHV
jgi:peptidoglycan/xylan/chitin deacetylase (PgdA/CDA1 family)